MARDNGKTGSHRKRHIDSPAIDGAWPLLKQTFSDWSEDKAPQLGASLAFYSALSIAPLLVIALGIAATFLGDNAARGGVVGQLESLVGRQGGEAIESMLESANKPGTGLIATTLSSITLLFGASGVFGQLQDALNTIWEVQAKPGRGALGWLKNRFISMAAVLGSAFLLLVSLLLTAALAAAGDFSNVVPESLAWLGQAGNFLLSIFVITCLFAMIFKLLPDVKMAWSDVWLGAFITAVLFTVGKFAIGIYLGRSTMASSYGVAGSFVVLLVWTYYSAQILFFGAEFTQVYANRYGSRILPDENAELISDDNQKQSVRK